MLGQFIETTVAETQADRILAQQAAAAAAASQAAADADAVQTASDRVASSASQAAAAGSATAAGSSATAAAGSATGAATSATNSMNSASAAAASATAASTSASNAASSATSASTSATNAAATLANALVKANNLSDVANAATARSNIGAAATSGTLAQFAATTSAQLAGVLSDETGTGSAVFGTGPTLNQPNIVGSTTGAAAAAGSIGEYIEVDGVSTPLTTSGVPVNLCSRLLPAGDYDVQSVVRFVPAAGTVMAQLIAGISSTSATFEALPTRTVFTLPFQTGQVQEFSSPVVRRLLTTATTVYCVASAQFNTSTISAIGDLIIRRRN